MTDESTSGQRCGSGRAGAEGCAGDYMRSDPRQGGMHAFIIRRRMHTKISSRATGTATVRAAARSWACCQLDVHSTLTSHQVALGHRVSSIPSHPIPYPSLPLLLSLLSGDTDSLSFLFASLALDRPCARLPGSRYATIHDSTRLTRLSTDTEAGSVNTICSLSQSQSHSSAPCLCGLRCKELCQPGVRPQLIPPVHPSTRPTSAATNLHVRPP